MVEPWEDRGRPDSVIYAWIEPARVPEVTAAMQFNVCPCVGWVDDPVERPTSPGVRLMQTLL